MTDTTNETHGTGMTDGTDAGWSRADSHRAVALAAQRITVRERHATVEHARHLVDGDTPLRRVQGPSRCTGLLSLRVAAVGDALRVHLR